MLRIGLAIMKKSKTKTNSLRLEESAKLEMMRPVEKDAKNRESSLL